MQTLFNYHSPNILLSVKRIPVTTVRRMLGFRMEGTAYRYGG